MGLYIHALTAPIYGVNIRGISMPGAPHEYSLKVESKCPSAPFAKRTSSYSRPGRPSDQQAINRYEQQMRLRRANWRKIDDTDIAVLTNLDRSIAYT